MSAGTSAKQALAREAWTSMLEFFFATGRPRMLELWREFDLQPQQQMVLGLLDEPRPMGELAQQMHCDSSNITGIVDRLSERGLVERRGDAADRRVKLVALTGAGEDLRDELVRRRSEPPDAIAELSEDDLHLLRRIFGDALGG